MKKLTCDFPAFTFMSNLSLKEKNEFIEIAHTHKYKKGDFIFQANQLDNRIFILLSGQIKIFRSAPGGKELIQWFYKQGEIFGLSEDNQSPHPSLTAQTLTKSEVLCITKKDFNKHILKHPKLALLIINQMSIRIRTLGDMLLNIASDDVMSRLTKILSRLSFQHGIIEGDSIILDIPLTQQELADMIGASRQTVNSSLSALRKQGYLEIQNHCIYIKDKNTLARYLQIYNENCMPVIH
jgi:CRP/FNR family transcriptional regulator, cyclic AMP receptor protein